MRDALRDADWQQFLRQGWLPLGSTLDAQQLGRLQACIDDIMLGRSDIDYDRIQMQLEATSAATQRSENSTGFKGATLAYRKIQDLELDAEFLTYLQLPLFRDICARAYGPQTAVASFRSMFMNKPAGYGSNLGWHQDRWNFLDRDPLVTVWTALDRVSTANGCVYVVPGSHLGLINPDHASGFLTESQTTDLLDGVEPLPLELEAGEAVLLHNWLAHSSGATASDLSRHAFSVCYMDAATESSNARYEGFRRVFGAGALAVDAAGRVA
jgi:phytanoyl-CoA hydroxylase